MFWCFLFKRFNKYLILLWKIWNVCFTELTNHCIFPILDNPSITVESCQHTDVLLECNCSKMAHELKWQKDSTSIYSNNSTMESYTDRIKMFRNESSKNCSILLKNIAEEDGGDYQCNFCEGTVYSRSTVTLRKL